MHYCLYSVWRIKTSDLFYNTRASPKVDFKLHCKNVIPSVIVGDLLHTCPKRDYDHSPGLLLLNNQPPNRSKFILRLHCTRESMQQLNVLAYHMY